MSESLEYKVQKQAIMLRDLRERTKWMDQTLANQMRRHDMVSKTILAELKRPADDVSDVHANYMTLLWALLQFVQSGDQTPLRNAQHAFKATGMTAPE